MSKLDSHQIAGSSRGGGVMEELNKGYEFTKAQIAELESLRAWKAELEKQEPIGEVTGYSTAVMYDQFLPGTKLFAAPVVSPDVDALKAELEELKASRGLRHVQQLQTENQSLKTELEAARNDAEKLKLLGEMRDGAVIWFNTNPHGWPDGTRYYAAIEQAKGGV